MQHFIKLGEADVLPLVLQLERHPELWNADAGRTARDGSPHSGVSDIWLRYRAKQELVSAESYNEPFFSPVWYPAFHVLSEVRPILAAIMTRVGCTALGGSLITKIPAGQAVLPHSDACSWHARTYLMKAYVVLRGSHCVNVCAGESLVMRPGECWSFDNLKEHSVNNDGPDDRVTLITSMRCD